MNADDDLSTLIENTPDLGWLRYAACGDLGLDQLELFFVEAGRTLSAKAAALCRSCPVRRECLDHAYQHDISCGYFSGLSPAKRSSLTHEEAMATLQDATSPSVHQA